MEGLEPVMACSRGVSGLATRSSVGALGRVGRRGGAEVAAFVVVAGVARVAFTIGPVVGSEGSVVGIVGDPLSVAS